jgi:hypothetical protein
VWCRNCNDMVANRPRGLCWSCYYTPGVRERFTPLSKHGCRGTGHSGSLPPDSPTGALPGSQEKIAILQRRAAAGMQLWHPADFSF